MQPAPGLEAILGIVRSHRPEVHPTELSRRRAATALTLHEGDIGPEILFMLRTKRPGDRWSGQMALPGGRWDPGDPDLVTTARRETFEEVGVELPPPVGRLDDQGARVAPVIVSTFVFTVDDRPDVVLDPREAEDAVWIPVAHLLDPVAAVAYPYEGIGVFHGIRYGRFTVWGLTLHTLESFFDLLGHELPRPAGITLT
ncbi:MAG TPA: CoA pyrophosphatase [Nitriliruptorales bacterium]